LKYWDITFVLEPGFVVSTDCTDWSSNPSRRYSHLQTWSHRFGSSPCLRLNECRGYFPGGGGGVKWPERDVVHKPPATTEGENQWSYTSTSPVPSWHVRDNFTFNNPFNTELTYRMSPSSSSVSQSVSQSVPTLTSPCSRYVLRFADSDYD
jgi:hypothetical protein